MRCCACEQPIIGEPFAEALYSEDRRRPVCSSACCLSLLKLRIEHLQGMTVPIAQSSSLGEQLRRWVFRKVFARGFYL